MGGRSFSNGGAAGSGTPETKNGVMQRYLSLWFPYLLTDWHARKQPQLRDVAFVLKAPIQNRAVVTAACIKAQALGIRPGAVLADARALVPDLHALDDKPGLTEQLLQRLAEWCIRFTPCASADAPQGLVLDVSGCAHLWGGEEKYMADIINRISTRSYTVRGAIADTVGAAWAMARFAPGDSIVEVGGQARALMPLPISSLRLETETLERLHKLGLRQVQDLLAIPRSSLRRRFGEHILLRLRQALGEEEERIVPVFPEEPFCERLPCLEPIVTRTGIEIALERLLVTLCERLRKEGKGVRTLVFRCYRVDGDAQGIEVGTSRASHNEEHLFHLFSLKLDTIEPRAGIDLFLLEATRVEDAAPVQERLWQVPGGIDDPRLAELIDRIAGKMGAHVLKRYLPAEHYWPERSFKKAGALEEPPATEWKVDRPRPLQLLAPPERIEVTAPVPDYPPLNFRYKGQLHKVIKADGPERIEPEWWIREGEHRDYYCVEDEEGKRYWVFRSGHYTADRTEEWWLHGFFA
jgi:protein ImuB